MQTLNQEQAEAEVLRLKPAAASIGEEVRARVSRAGEHYIAFYRGGIEVERRYHAAEAA